MFLVHKQSPTNASLIGVISAEQNQAIFTFQGVGKLHCQGECYPIGIRPATRIRLEPGPESGCARGLARKKGKRLEDSAPRTRLPDSTSSRKRRIAVPFVRTIPIAKTNCTFAPSFAHGLTTEFRITAFADYAEGKIRSSTIWRALVELNFHSDKIA